MVANILAGLAVAAALLILFAGATAPLWYRGPE